MISTESNFSTETRVYLSRVLHLLGDKILPPPTPPSSSSTATAETASCTSLPLDPAKTLASPEVSTALSGAWRLEGRTDIPTWRTEPPSRVACVCLVMILSGFWLLVCVVAPTAVYSMQSIILDAIRIVSENPVLLLSSSILFGTGLIGGHFTGLYDEPVSKRIAQRAGKRMALEMAMERMTDAIVDAQTGTGDDNSSGSIQFSQYWKCMIRVPDCEKEFSLQMRQIFEEALRDGMVGGSCRLKSSKVMWPANAERGSNFLRFDLSMDMVTGVQHPSATTPPPCESGVSSTDQ